MGNKTAMTDASRTDLEHQYETAKRAIADCDADIARSTKMRDVWIRIKGALEYQMHGRILP